MLCHANLSETARSEHFAYLISLFYVIHIFKTFKIFEIQYVTIFLLLCYGRAVPRWCQARVSASILFRVNRHLIFNISFSLIEHESVTAVRPWRDGHRRVHRCVLSQFRRYVLVMRSHCNVIIILIHILRNLISAIIQLLLIVSLNFIIINKMRRLHAPGVTFVNVGLLSDIV